MSRAKQNPGSTPNGDSPVTSKRRAVDELVDVLDSRFFKALGEPVRVEILKHLMLNGCCDVGNVAQSLPQDRSVISRHLNQMFEAGLLRCRKEGRYCFYEVDNGFFLKRAESITDAIKRCIVECDDGTFCS